MTPNNLTEAREALDALHSDSNDFWSGNKREEEASDIRKALTHAEQLERQVETLTSEVSRLKGALDKADNLFMDNGTISAAEHKIIETGKAIRSALSNGEG